MAVTGMVSCQIEKKPESRDASAANGIEITLECKNANKEKVEWQFTMMGRDLYGIFGQDEPQRYLELDKQDVQDLEALLNDCKAHKIKTKQVANNDKKEWFSARISTFNYTLDVTESQHNKLTKKSRKKIHMIYKYLTHLLKSEGVTGPLHAEAK